VCVCVCVCVFLLDIGIGIADVGRLHVGVALVAPYDGNCCCTAFVLVRSQLLISHKERSVKQSRSVSLQSFLFQQLLEFLEEK